MSTISVGRQLVNRNEDMSFGQSYHNVIHRETIIGLIYVLLGGLDGSGHK